MEVPGGGGVFGLYEYVPAGQGMIFWPHCPKQCIQFDLPLS